MYPSVRAAFRAFNEPFEGVVPWMYLDIKGLVTVGVGNLIDPIELALQLPFRFRNEPNLAATTDQIAAEWHRIKAATGLAKAGYKACEPLTRLGLDDAAIDDSIAIRLAENEAILKKSEFFRGFDSWPADAQLRLLSMAWALGPNGPKRFQKFAEACRNLDFVRAADNCAINAQGNPGIVPRNRANQTLFETAGQGPGTGDPSQLRYMS
jgi:hypothetical protein